MARFDKFNEERNGATETAEPIATVENTNGRKATAAYISEGSVSASKKRSPGDESELSNLENTPPQKKHKKQRSAEDEDAALAAKLQAEYNAASRARSTRGGSTKKRAPAPKKKVKKKSANTVKDEDDSELGSGSGADKKEVKRTGGFHVCPSCCVHGGLMIDNFHRNPWPCLPHSPSSWARRV
jgi:upstream activation factor subunit UAF30